MTTENKNPITLGKDPIHQATFEIRFHSDAGGTAELLPGLLFSSLEGAYSSVETLPAGEMPKAFRDQLPNAAYVGLKRLVGAGTYLSIAERSIAVEVLRPYWGWDKFSTLIFKVVAAATGTDLIGEIERVSLRYQNLLTTKENLHDFSGLHLEISIADYQLRNGGFQLRVEVEHDQCLSIINVAGSANFSQVVEEKKINTVGLLLDIDTIKQGPFPSFATDYKTIIGQVHEAEKNVFFSMLKKETIDQLKPVWD